LSVSGAYGVRSSDTDRTVLTNAVGTLNGLLNRLLVSALTENADQKASAPPLDVEFKVQPDQTEDGVKFDQVKFGYTLQGLPEESKTTLDQVQRLLDLKIARKDNVSYFALGSGGLKDLKTVLAGTVPGKPLKDSTNYEKALKLLDDKPQAFLHLNVAKIINLIAKASEQTIKVSEDYPGLLATVSYSPKGESTSLVILTDELKGYVNVAIPLLMMGGLR